MRNPLQSSSSKNGQRELYCMLTAWYVTHKTMHACENRRIASTTCSSLCSSLDSIRDKAWYVTSKTMHACENRRIASTTCSFLCSSLASIRDTVWYVTPETMHASEKEELPAQHVALPSAIISH